MPGSILQRLTCIIKLHTIDSLVRPSYFEAILRSFEWYGLHRKMIRKRISVSRSHSGHQEINWRGMTIILPGAFPIRRFADMIVETEVPTNPHYFFHSQHNLQVRGIVIDAGACEGLYTLLAAKRWKDAKFLAIEPGPEMSEALRKTIDLNHLSDRVRVETCLLGNESCEVNFIENVDDPTCSRILPPNETVTAGQRAIRIRMKRLDEIVKDSETVSVIKMDAEGAELEILKGAEAIMRRDRPSLCITTYHNRDDAMQIYSWVKQLDLDYELKVRGVTCMSDLVPRPLMLFGLPR